MDVPEMWPLICICGSRHADESSLETIAVLPTPKRLYPEWQADRILACGACQLRRGIRCGVLVDRGKPGLIMHPKGLFNPKAASVSDDCRWPQS